MSSRFRAGPEHHQAMAIPIRTVAEVFERLDGCLGRGNVMLIGGQAVNFWCHKQRSSHDIDVIVRRELTDADRQAFRGAGFVPLHGNKEAGYTYNDHYFGVVKIDLISAGRQVNGISPETLFANAVEHTAYPSGPTMTILDKWLLIVMKARNGGGQDREDIGNLLHNFYRGSPERFVDIEYTSLVGVLGAKGNIAALETNLKEMVSDDAAIGGLGDALRHD